jgi:undecaprenyl diphosphate synthase
LSGLSPPVQIARAAGHAPIGVDELVGGELVNRTIFSPRDSPVKQIGTSGEQRLSDFLPWESAYAELHFTERMWPDFGAEDLAEALRAFRGRERRFGGLQPLGPERAVVV